jgi:hypothetical protein
MFIEKDINGFKFRYEDEILYKKCRKSGVWKNCKLLVPTNNGYLRVCCSKDNKEYSYFYHRIVYKMFNESFEFNNPKLKIDHKDRNKLNNKISNLKQVTSQENSQNTNAYGVCYKKDGRKKPWGARWSENGKGKSKYFSTEPEAKNYRDNKVKELYYLGDRDD